MHFKPWAGMVSAVPALGPELARTCPARAQAPDEPAQRPGLLRCRPQQAGQRPAGRGESQYPEPVAEAAQLYRGGTQPCSGIACRHDENPGIVVARGPDRAIATQPHELAVRRKRARQREPASQARRPADVGGETDAAGDQEPRRPCRHRPARRNEFKQRAGIGTDPRNAVRAGHVPRRDNARCRDRAIRETPRRPRVARWTPERRNL